jgi:transposase-like protein
MNVRGRVSRVVWEKRIERWLESGLTAKEFAAEIDVRPNSLGYWRKLLRAESASTEQPAASPER